MQHKPYIQYAKDVVKGKVVAGKLVKLACKRFLDDLKNKKFYFDYEKADRALAFFELFKHYTGKHAGKSFTLAPWQTFIVANIVGFYMKDTGRRRFTRSYIQVARKSGKTALAAVLCLYFLLADGENSAEVLLLANSKDQAKNVDFKAVKTFIEQLDPKKKRIIAYRDKITIKNDPSQLLVLASESKTGDGYNCSFGLIDEFHEADDTKLLNLVLSSQGMRENPHCCIITTAGLSKNKPCYGLRETYAEILHGLKEDDNLFAIIYEQDEDDDYRNPKVWVKSNPNLGITVSPDYLRSQIQIAVNSPSEEHQIRTKNFNQWCDSIQTWIPDSYINAACKPVNFDDLGAECLFVGVDLSATSDLAAVTYLWVDPESGKYYFKTRYYLPQSALVEKQNKELYRSWQNMGLLTVTPGNATDYDFITEDLIKMNDKYILSVIAYDQWNASQWAITCTSVGLNLQPYSQSIGSFNQPTKEFERLIRKGNVVLDNNEITRFCFRNVLLKMDHNANIKPYKTEDKNKIDGVISKLQALGGYLVTPQYDNSI